MAAEQEPFVARWRRRIDFLIPYIGPLIIGLVLVVVFYAIRGFLEHVSYRSITHAIHQTSRRAILTSEAFVFLSFLSLTGYDWSAMRYIGARLPYLTIAFGSFCGYAVGNTAGLTLVTGGSVRYRIYSSAGLSAGQIAIVTVFTMLTFGLGVTFLGGAGLAIQPDLVADALSVPNFALRILGLGIIGLTSALVLYAYRRNRPIHYHGVTLRLPSGPIMIGQILISCFDLGFAALSLWALLPNSAGVGFLGFSAIYCAAMLAGVSTHVPGGVGVFEAVIIFALRGVIPLEQLAGALVLWRCLYYFVPLILAAIGLAFHEIVQDWRGVERTPASIVPPIMTALAFAAGVLLMVTTATPTPGHQLAWVGMILPLSMIEASHLLSSVLGLVLLVLAYGLYHRLNGAYWLTIFCLVLGIAAALAKGFDVTAAGFLMIVLLALLPCRAEFYRPTSLLDQRPEPAWIVALFLTVGGSLWLADFAFRRMDYSEAQFWTFALKGEAPRAARAGVVLASGALMVGLITLLRPPKAAPEPADFWARDKAAELARAVGRALDWPPEARVFFGPGEKSAIIFTVHGRHWTAHGDPVGEAKFWAELIWEFRERADRARAQPDFLNAERAAGLFADAGLNPTKASETPR